MTTAVQDKFEAEKLSAQQHFVRVFAVLVADAPEDQAQLPAWLCGLSIAIGVLLAKLAAPQSMPVGPALDTFACCMREIAHDYDRNRRAKLQ